MERTPVLICGAGPTGLVLALWLAQQGIRPRIIDKAEKPGETSRAIALHARTLEFYDQLGLADDVIAAGIRIDNLRFRLRGDSAKDVVVPFHDFGAGISPHPYVLSFPQDHHERLLVEALQKHGVVIERNTALLDFKQSSEGVEARIQTPQSEQRVAAEYLCGCDGARSAVRQGLSHDFPGGTYSDIFYVADAEVQGDAPFNDLTVTFTDSEFCLVIPVRNQKTLRLIGIVPPAAQQKQHIVFDDVATSVAQATGLDIQRIAWFSTYHVHHRVAPHFREGRVFIAGDAAHIHSPAGGQGMNTGIGDAINLGWKLASVLKGAPATLLDTYEPERRAFATRLVATTDTAFQGLVSRKPFAIWWRLHAVPRLMKVVSSFTIGRRLLFRTISQTAINYRRSALSRGRAGAVQAGDRLPWAHDNYTPLASKTWQAHVYGVVPGNVLAAVHGIPVYHFAAAPPFESGSLYLLRPDGYIGLIATDPDSVAKYRAVWGI